MAKGPLSLRLEAATDVMGHRRYLLAPLFGTFIGFIDWVLSKLATVGMSGLIGVPSWAIGVFAALLLILWWFLEDAVKMRRRIRGTRVGLSELRKQGVDLRNRGRDPLLDRTTWEDWKKGVEDWNARVIDRIKEINEADAIWFSVLDIVMPPRVAPMVGGKDAPAEPWVEDRLRLYQWHDNRVSRLGEMIRGLWRD